MTMRKGDAIEIEHDHRKVQGEIVMISENQVSLMIKFDAMIGGHAGMMPATRHDKERHIYRSIIDGTEVMIRERQR